MNTASAPLRLSLVIPVYNFATQLEPNVLQILRELKDAAAGFELILVNDGSSDDTPVVMARLAAAHPELCVIDYPVNRGKGHAVRRGVLAARGEYVFFTDVDLPYGLAPIFEGLRLMARERVDVVLGSRDLAESEDIRSYSLKRKITKKAFSLIVNLLLGIGISDTQCGLKGFRTPVAKDIFGRLTRSDFSFDVEVLYLAKSAGYIHRLLPVHLNHSKSSTVSVVRDSLKMLRSVFAITLNILTGKYDRFAQSGQTGRDIEC